MGITNSNKTISVDRIECDGTLRVTLALTAAPDIVTNPTDIALVLDRSGSMTGTPLTNMKAGRGDRRHGRRSDRFRQPYRNRQLFEHCDGRYAANHFGRHTEKRCQFVDCRRQHQPRRRVYQSDRAV